MEKWTNIINKVLVALIIVVIVCIGVNMVQNSFKSSVEDIANDLTILYNARYTGKSEELIQAINKRLISDAKTQMLETFQKEDSTTIDLTEEIEKDYKFYQEKLKEDKTNRETNAYEYDVKAIDENLELPNEIKKDGNDKYYIDLKNISFNSEGVYTLNIYLTSYTIDEKDYKDNMMQFKGNEKYNFKPYNYGIYTNSQNGKRYFECYFTYSDEKYGLTKNKVEVELDEKDHFIVDSISDFISSL